MLNTYIDHTCLSPTADQIMVKKLCEEAKKYQFASVCVHPYFLSDIVQYLRNTKIAITTVVGFPLGANQMETKVFEASKALEGGATELDVVINISALKQGQESYIVEELGSIKQRAGLNLVKVILETCYLTDKEKILACELCMEAGVDFVKTSTGFGLHGASIEDILLLRKIVGSRLGVKASGGIRNMATALQMIHAGANRIGTSSGVLIMEEEALGKR